MNYYGLALVITLWVAFTALIIIGGTMLNKPQPPEDNERLRMHKTYLNGLFIKTVAPLTIDKRGTSRSCVNSWEDREEEATKAAYAETVRLQNSGYTEANSLTKATYDLAAVLRECNRGQSVVSARAYARQLLMSYRDFLKDSNTSQT